MRIIILNKFFFGVRENAAQDPVIETKERKDTGCPLLAGRDLSQTEAGLIETSIF